jgi:hypothetical protein
MNGFLAAILLLSQPLAAEPAAAWKAQVIGHLGDARLRETSGLAVSHRHAGRYWVHNDSGDGPFVYAIDAQGKLAGIVQVDGVMSIDWEDIASFERDGKAYLLIGDIGDNLGMRPQYELIAIEEPELPADGSVLHVPAAWEVRFRYPDDTSHDTESLAVDAATMSAYVVPKFFEPLTAYRVPLKTDDDEIVEATRWADFAAPEGVDPHAAPKFRPTAFDIAADGRHAALLGYRSAWIYTRRGKESWEATLARAPQRVSVAPPLRQPEALGFERDGRSILVTGEGVGEALLRIELSP